MTILPSGAALTKSAAGMEIARARAMRHSFIRPSFVAIGALGSLADLHGARRKHNPGFPNGPTSPLLRRVEWADHPVAQLVHPFQQVEEVMLATHRRSRPRAWEFGHSECPFQRHLRCLGPRSSSPSLRACGSRSRGVPRESLDAPEAPRADVLRHRRTT